MTKLLGVRAVYRSGDTKIYEYGADSLHSKDTNVKDQSNYAFSPVLDGGKSMPPLKQLAPYSAVVASIQVNIHTSFRVHVFLRNRFTGRQRGK